MFFTGLYLWVIRAIALVAVTFITSTGICDWLAFGHKYFVLHLVPWICLWWFLEGHTFFYHSKNAEKCGSFELLRLPLCLVEEDGARRNTLDFFYIVQQVGWVLSTLITLCDKSSSLPHLHKECYQTSRISAWAWLHFLHLWQLWSSQFGHLFRQHNEILSFQVVNIELALFCVLWKT